MTYTYSIGLKFPDWVEMKCLTPDRTFDQINPTMADGWKVIYFYPKDFTFVCPTEIVDFDNLIRSGAGARTLLQNIRKEIKNCYPEYNIPKHGLLKKWAKKENLNFYHKEVVLDL